MRTILMFERCREPYLGIITSYLSDVLVTGKKLNLPSIVALH